jgi:hypothetical protein
MVASMARSSGEELNMEGVGLSRAAAGTPLCTLPSYTCSCIARTYATPLCRYAEARSLRAMRAWCALWVLCLSTPTLAT